MIINKNNVEISNGLYDVTECAYALNLISPANKVFLDFLEFGSYGYARLSDWTRLIKKVDRYDYTPLRRYILGDRKKIEYEEYTIELIDKAYSKFRIIFKDPIVAIFSEIGKDFYSGEEVEIIEGELSHSWYYTGGTSLVGKYMDGLDIYLENINIIK